MNARIVHDARLVPELCALFAAARTSITILQYAFDLHPPIPQRLKLIAHALLDAAARGVHVRILINTKHGAAPGSPDALHLARYLHHPNLHIYYHRASQVMHAKTILIDMDTTVIGSHNLTRTSLYSSLNLSVIIVDLELALALRDLVFPLFQEPQIGKIR